MTYYSRNLIHFTIYIHLFDLSQSTNHHRYFDLSQSTNHHRLFDLSQSTNHHRYPKLVTSITSVILTLNVHSTSTATKIRLNLFWIGKARRI